MSDIEANNRTVKSKECPQIYSVLRTIFHSFCFILFVFVLSWGFKIWYTIQGQDITDPILKDLKILTPFFFTNWNFISLMCTVSIWGCYILANIQDDEATHQAIMDAKNFSIAHLTNWNLSFQTIFLGLSLVHDAMEWLDMKDGSLATKIRYWRNVIFSGMVVPFTLFVTSMFWCVYAIDRELVFPKVYDSVVPWWFNHCVHTNITIVVIIETLLQPRRKPTDKRLELILFWIIALLYAVVYYTIYFVTGRWLYQVFGTMNWWQVCLYQLGIWLSSYIFYKMQFPINRLFHGPEEDFNIQEDTAQKNANVKVNDNPDVRHNKSIEGSDGEDGTLPKDSWSLKFRSIKNHVENSRL